MAPSAYLLTLVTSILLFGAAQGQNFPICSRSDTTDFTTLGRCADTTVFAIRAVSNASDGFEQACTNLDYDRAADEGLDIAFLKFLVCGKFGGQGRFYENTDDAITAVALLRVAMEVAAEDDTNPALRFICPGLSLSLYRKFQLSSDTIYDITCGNIFLPVPSNTVPIPTISTTSSPPGSIPTASPSILTTPSIYTTSTTSWPSGYSSTSCTTSSSSSIAIYRRQEDDSDDVDFWIKVINSALWALGLIESDEDDERCDVGDYWVDQWDSMGFFGDYVQALM